MLGSLAPAALTALGVANTAAAGVIPPSVVFSFYIGAFAILASVLWTVATTREYPPERMREFHGMPAPVDGETPAVAPQRGLLWLAAGVVVLALVAALGLERDLYVLGGALVAFGGAQLVARWRVGAGRTSGALVQIMSDLVQMPGQMRRLAVVQFFSWLALFIMWIYTTPVVTQYVFGSVDTTSKSYNAGADWVGILFSIYNGVAAIAAFLLPPLAKRIGPARTHMLCLLVGAASYAVIVVIRDPNALVLPMIGIGLAWASILTMPYVILAGALPPGKLGIYMGIFNFFIVLPQLMVATIMGGTMRAFFPGQPIWTMVVAAVVMAIAALAMLRVDDGREEPSRVGSALPA